MVIKQIRVCICRRIQLIRILIQVPVVGVDGTQGKCVNLEGFQIIFKANTTLLLRSYCLIDEDIKEKQQTIRVNEYIGIHTCSHACTQTSTDGDIHMNTFQLSLFLIGILRFPTVFLLYFPCECSLSLYLSYNSPLAQGHLAYGTGYTPTAVPEMP